MESDRSIASRFRWLDTRPNRCTHMHRRRPFTPHRLFHAVITRESKRLIVKKYTNLLIVTIHTSPFKSWFIIRILLWVSLLKINAIQFLQVLSPLYFCIIQSGYLAPKLIIIPTLANVWRDTGNQDFLTITRKGRWGQVGQSGYQSLLKYGVIDGNRLSRILMDRAWSILVPCSAHTSQLFSINSFIFINMR